MCHLRHPFSTRNSKRHSSTQDASADDPRGVCRSCSPVQSHPPGSQPPAAICANGFPESEWKPPRFWLVLSQIRDGDRVVSRATRSTYPIQHETILIDTHARSRTTKHLPSSSCQQGRPRRGATAYQQFHCLVNARKYTRTDFGS